MGPRVCRLDGAAAGQPSGQQFAHQREARALVLAERQQRAARLTVHHRRIGGRRALRVYDQTIGQRLALRHGDSRLPHCDAAGGHVEQRGRRVLGTRDGDAYRVGNVTRLRPAPWRDRGDMVGDIDEMQ